MDLQRAVFVKIYTAVSLNSRVLTKGMGANIPGNPLLFILCDTKKILYKILHERALSKLLCFYGAFPSSCSAYLKVRATLSGLRFFFLKVHYSFFAAVDVTATRPAFPMPCCHHDKHLL